MEFRKDELLIIDYALKQLKAQTNKDIIKACNDGLNTDQAEKILKDIEQVANHITKEIQENKN